MAQVVKNLPTMWETWVRCLDWEDPMGESMATHPSIQRHRLPTPVFLGFPSGSDSKTSTCNAGDPMKEGPEPVGEKSHVLYSVPRGGNGNPH